MILLHLALGHRNTWGVGTSPDVSGLDTSNSFARPFLLETKVMVMFKEISNDILVAQN